MSEHNSQANSTQITFGGPVTVVSRILAVAVLLFWPYGQSASILLFVPLLALWVLATLGIFSLELTRHTLARSLGPNRITCRWDALTCAEVQPVLFFGRVRLVFLCTGGQRISFPLFLLAADTRAVLADQIVLHLPEALKAHWSQSGFDQVVRGARQEQ